MIKLKEVKTVHGKTFLTLQYDLPDGSLAETEIDEVEILEKVRQVEDLLGVKANKQVWIGIVKQLINKLREGKQPFREKIDYLSLIGVDLEKEEIKG
ncbi:hypothetical protein CW703_06920 [Candidatus Bathyarchaeota archaeon]|nr:MAG: hypothetical protein CW703_06920 [Candidatus Bathyarchaeota archaeon]